MQDYEMFAFYSAAALIPFHSIQFDLFSFIEHSAYRFSLSLRWGITYKRQLFTQGSFTFCFISFSLFIIFSVNFRL